MDEECNIDCDNDPSDENGEEEEKYFQHVKSVSSLEDEESKGEPATPHLYMNEDSK
jgi:hypothetical protein